MKLTAMSPLEREKGLCKVDVTAQTLSQNFSAAECIEQLGNVKTPDEYQNKHCKSCKCHPVSLLNIRSQRLS